MKKYNLIIGILFIIILSSSKSRTDLTQSTENLLGTWIMVDSKRIGEADSFLSSKWVFSNDGNCKWYENDELVDTFRYSISNYSCDNSFNGNYKTLKLLNNYSVENRCYGINGFSEYNGKIYLSIEVKGNPTPIVFEKYKFLNPKVAPDPSNPTGDPDYK